MSRLLPVAISVATACLLAIAGGCALPTGSEKPKGRAQTTQPPPSQAEDPLQKTQDPASGGKFPTATVLGVPLKTSISSVKILGRDPSGVGYEWEALVQVLDYKGGKVAGLTADYFSGFQTIPSATSETVDTTAGPAYPLKVIEASETSESTYRLKLQGGGFMFDPSKSSVFIQVHDKFDPVLLSQISMPSNVQLFPSSAKLTGRFTIGSNSPVQPLTAQFKAPGSSREAEKATTDVNGNFFFTSAMSGNEYQIIWDDGGQEASSNTIAISSVIVSQVLKSPPDNLSIPQLTVDIGWNLQASPSLNASVTKSSNFKFEFNPYGQGYFYQISLFNSSKTAVSATATSSTSPISVDLSALSTGNYFYQVKFIQAGGIFGGRNAYGSSKFIPFKVN